MQRHGDQLALFNQTDVFGIDVNVFKAQIAPVLNRNHDTVPIRLASGLEAEKYVQNICTVGVG